MTKRRTLRGRPVVGWYVRLAVVAAIAGAGVVIYLYRGVTFWPELLAGFGASLLAFMLALEWEAEREFREVERELDDQQTRRRVEAQRRLKTIAIELARDDVSIRSLMDHFTGKNPYWAAERPGFKALQPELLAGAWEASGPRLAELLENVELTADLAVFYGRLEELRWRLRFRTEQASTDLDGATHALVSELVKEVGDLCMRVASELDEPRLIQAPFISSRTVVF